MGISEIFIRRPVATVLLSVALVLVGGLGFRLLSIEQLPKMDFPVISISASMPGASAPIMATTVAAPLERAMGTISGVSSMNSRSSVGSARITLQFDYNKDTNVAFREVQAAINKSQQLLPSAMRSLPTVRKANPSAAPIMAISLTSETLSKPQLYDIASTKLVSRIAQIKGVGDVQIGGSSLPAIRISVEPRLLEHYGISLEEVRGVISSVNARTPKGFIEYGQKQYEISLSDQLRKVSDYETLIVKYKDGVAVRMQDIATVVDDVQDRYTSGFANDKDAILLVVSKQSDANILQTIEDIKNTIPILTDILGTSSSLEIVMDRSNVIRETLKEAEIALAASIMLVVLVVIIFLGNLQAAVIPAISVVVSIISSFAVMYFLGFSLNLLSLMALIVATGLVVDDAIVVLENIVRYIEQGIKPIDASIRGAKEMGFTLVSINVSLIAVFITILFMGEIINKLFREFAITLTISITISLLVAITLTPMLCACYLDANSFHNKNAFFRFTDKINNWMLQAYRYTLIFALKFKFLVLLSFFTVIYLNVYLFINIPKTMIPAQDTGQLMGFLRGDDGLSFNVMAPKMDIYKKAVIQDPAVASVAGFISGGTNSFFIIKLKPMADRKVSATNVAARIRRNIPKVAGSRFFVMPMSDIQLGGRRSEATSDSEVMLLSDDLSLLKKWLPRARDALKALPELTDLDVAESGAASISIDIDRQTAGRYGIDMASISSTLNNSFSQRQVSTIYEQNNQYPVIMEVKRNYAMYSENIDDLKVINNQGIPVPLSTFSRRTNLIEEDTVYHQGQFAVENISFALNEGVTLSDAVTSIKQSLDNLTMPTAIQTQFSGSAGSFSSNPAGNPFMVLFTIIIVYIVLGILYESYIHPLTILSTLPSAGIGALLALKMASLEFSLIAMLGIYMLIGIVKKNAILMIDYALQIEKERNISSYDAIFEACLLRFRPILMTTVAAILGALPLVLNATEGSEMRQPLGISVVGGLIVSQILTLYTTPVIYLYFSKLSHKINSTQKIYY